MEHTKSESNKTIARQAIESFEKKDYPSLEKITDRQRYRLHFAGNPTPMNYDENVKLMKEYNTAFPDAKLNVEFQIAEGDMVASRVNFSGTQKGELQGLPASGKTVKVTGIFLHRIVDGKIVEEWNEYDSLGMMQQIGVVSQLESHR